MFAILNKVSQLKEPSTYGGVAALFMALGFAVPHLQEISIALGSVAALAAVFLPETKK